ncbi:5,6-dimethylbenzimidazole synthase [Litoreibacter albidus]|uniref:Cob(II)yrinic acid a,c-diamide reductase n=1 Tax=Litoreibacter albidus TaxID=670155 RepID=A0A1H2QMA2_9RHOB|nr:5,6-dimethylbenzimidazole synthase [Litoreibacter albidus]SDW08286.1 cob(II)yrinic acid a,c-diamide reductase [Litoreibacter albidus]
MREFEPDFRDELYELMRWRRDVRRFRTTPVDEALLMRCLDAFSHAPSVGLSEPWRIVRVDSAKARAAARANFEIANAEALTRYDGDQADTYAKLKLAGMDRAPVQLAIFCDDATTKGHGLGAGTMPEMRRYSVVSAVTLFWLAARAEGLGLGWVSVLDPAQLCHDLDVPQDWALIGYFCIGYPEGDHETPELLREGWEARAAALDIRQA